MANRLPERRRTVLRPLVLALVSVVALGLCAVLAGQPSDGPVPVRLRLVQAATGKGIGGIVRVALQGEDEPIPLPGLFDRLRGLKTTKEARGWYVVPAKGIPTTLPRARLRIEAVSGLETSRIRQDLELRKE